MSEEIKQDWPCRFTNGIPREECPIHNSDDICSKDDLPCDCQEYVPAAALTALRAKNAELEKELEQAKTLITIQHKDSSYPFMCENGYVFKENPKEPDNFFLCRDMVDGLCYDYEPEDEDSEEESKPCVVYCILKYLTTPPPADQLPSEPENARTDQERQT